MTKYKIQYLGDDVLIAADGVWVPGVYDSRATAVAVAKAFSDAEIEELFGPIYTVNGENRKVTMKDYERIKDERTKDVATGETN
jgi:hypothetical protein